MVRIKKSKYPILIFLIILLPMFLNLPPKENFSYINTLRNIQNSSSALCKNYLLDKVFTFSIGDTVLNKSFDLEENYYYYITTEVVTPHNCEIEVFIVSPKNKVIRILKGNLYYNSLNFKELMGEHGTAYNGNHTFLFSVQAEKKLNIHLKIEKGEPVFPDPPPDPPVIPPNVTQFYDEETLTINASLVSDWSYKFFIKRVSTYAGNETGECRLALNISDQSTIPFEIYANETILDPFETVSFSFGTAWSGVYSIHIYVYFESKTVNIAFAIAKDFQITCEPPPVNNQTGQSNQTQTGALGKLFIPKELIVVIGCISAPCVVISAIVIGYTLVRKKNKKKNEA